MELKLPVDLTQVKDPQLKSFLQKLDLKAYFEIDETETDFTLTDDYLVHENSDYNSLPLEIAKKDLI
jgi:hypothetical protein